ncbi:MAG: hypothetical protein JWP44_4525 [Mucilaginibacter sp.]|nr:hypothetical protein [Mucilaginibacter sp.]
MAISLPTAELHARYLEMSLTRYSLDEIAAAAAEFNALELEYTELVDAVQALLDAKYDTTFTGWQCQLNAADRRLYELLDSALIPVAEWGRMRSGRSREKWPLSVWRRESAAYRRLIKRIKASIGQ